MRRPGSDPSSRPPAGEIGVPAESLWAPMPYRDIAHFDADSLLRAWPRLHAGQGSPPAPAPALAEGWALYHSGEFQRAAALGYRHGREGLPLAWEATAIYAHYLEPREPVRMALLGAVAEQAGVQAGADPDDWQALYWQAYALGRYSQGISVARSMAHGLGRRIKGALERVIALQPAHADAHIALASFHAEAIDKVGPLVARMTYDARAELAMAHYERGLALHPGAPGALMDYARGLLMLHGSSRLDEATHLYEQAAAMTPADAHERLDVELARAGLAD